MKLNKLCFVFILLTMIVACKDKDKSQPTPQVITPPTSSTVKILITHEVDGVPLEFGKMKYTNAAGNQYQVDMLKYYFTNVILVRADNSQYVLGNYDLINASDPLTCYAEGRNIPNGTFTKIKFGIGIPQDRNHNGAQDGDLDPIMGMIWDWNTGYVFFKHEGMYKNASSVNKPLVFHFATDRAFTALEMPLSQDLVLNGTEKTIKLKFNLNKLYTTPENVNFNVDNNRQSSSSSDFQWIDKHI